MKMLKTTNLCKRGRSAVSRYYYTLAGTIALSLAAPIAHAANDDQNPFPSISPDNNGDIVATAGSSMEAAMKYLSIGLGGLLILICLGVIIHRMREDSREKDHGNLIMTYVLCALGMTLGFVLIGIGWKAFNTQIN